MAVLKTSKGRELILGPKIGGGGEGDVFAITNSPNEAVKIYLSRDKISPEKKRKLQAMVRIGTPGLVKNAAWPTALIDGPSFALVMPRAAGIEIHDAYGPKSRMLKFPLAKFRFLVTAAYNLCAALHEIHAVDAVIGDFNERNILVTEEARICFVDCDSFQISSGNELFRCLVGTPDNLAPEAHGTDFTRLIRSKNQDNFTLALLIFRLLFLGRHPFAGVGGADIELPEAIKRHLYAYGNAGAAAGIKPPDAVLKLSALPAVFSSLFDRAFAAHSHHAVRPTPSEWAENLRRLRESIVQCRSNASHEYPSSLISCPWCELYSKFHVSFFLNDNQHDFRIEAATFAELGARIIALLPISFPILAALPAGIGPKSFPDNLTARGAGFYFGFPLGAGALALVVTGYWFFGLILGWWAAALLSADPGKKKRSDFKSTLSAELALANKAKLEGENSLSRVQRAYYGEFDRQKGLIRSLLLEYQELPNERRKRILDLNSKLRELQLEEFLDRIFIAHAFISGIGDERKARLRAYGIETASDINANIRIPGVGPTLRSSLMRWRQLQELKFTFDPTRKVDPREIQKVDAALVVRKQEIEQRISASKALLEKLTREASARDQSERQAVVALSFHAEELRITLERFTAKYPF